jgi:signal transduction histidine kinase
MIFYSLVFLTFFCWFSVLIGLAFVLEEPTRKRITNIENMLSKHIEDSKATIETMKHIDESNQEIIKILKSK